MDTDATEPCRNATRHLCEDYREKLDGTHGRPDGTCRKGEVVCLVLVVVGVRCHQNKHE